MSLGIPLIGRRLRRRHGLMALAAGYHPGTQPGEAGHRAGRRLSGMFGLGIVLYTQIETDAHLDHILFGNMLGVGAADLWTAGLIAGRSRPRSLLKWRDLLLHMPSIRRRRG
jgi:manganese/iron transport system permease protein